VNFYFSAEAVLSYWSGSAFRVEAGSVRSANRKLPHFPRRKAAYVRVCIDESLEACARADSRWFLSKASSKEDRQLRSSLLKRFNLKVGTGHPENHRELRAESLLDGQQTMDTW